MRRQNSERTARGVTLVAATRYKVDVSSLKRFTRNLERRMRVEEKGFNVCLMDDAAIRQLNARYRGKHVATDVLSFPWNEAVRPSRPVRRVPSAARWQGGITGFLGDVAISVETARRQAAREGHSTLNEIRWLVLHGVLHLLGYDHERDDGEMVALELSLREQLGGAGGRELPKQAERQRTRVNKHNRNPSGC